MNTQTALAAAVVLLCGAFAMRSWIAFWIALIRSPNTTGSTKTGCSGCANGCQKASDGPRFVELKREPRWTDTDA